MAFIYGVLCEEYDRLKSRKQNYEEELKQLPKGKLVKKRIKGKEYNYLMYRADNKVKTDYIKKDNLEKMCLQIERREKLEKKIVDIDIDLKLIEKVIKDE